MTVAELIDWLGQYDGELPVRIASQPAWPFENDVANVAEYDGTSHLELHLDEHENTWVVDDHAAEERLVEGLESHAAGEQWIAAYAHAHPTIAAVYLYEGRQIGYLPAGAREGFEH